LDNTVRIWDIGTGLQLHRIDALQWQVEQVTFLDQGTVVYHQGRGKVFIWHLEEPTSKALYTFSRDRLDYATAYARNGQLVAYITNPPFRRLEDGRLIAPPPEEHRSTVHVIDVHTSRELLTKVLQTDQSEDITGMAFSPDGHLLAVADSGSDTIHLWPLPRD
jgi:WD40 repeat protein